MYVTKSNFSIALSLALIQISPDLVMLATVCFEVVVFFVYSKFFAKGSRLRDLLLKRPYKPSSCHHKITFTKCKINGKELTFPTYYIHTNIHTQNTIAGNFIFIEKLDDY